MVIPKRALADTSVFIGLEAARFDGDRFSDYEWGVSAITLGELRLGVLQARSPEAMSRRLSTYQLAQRFEALAVDEAVSDVVRASSYIKAPARRGAKSRSTTVGSLRPRSLMGFRS